MRLDESLLESSVYDKYLEAVVPKTQMLFNIPFCCTRGLAYSTQKEEQHHKCHQGTTSVGELMTFCVKWV